MSADFSNSAEHLHAIASDALALAGLIQTGLSIGSDDYSDATFGLYLKRLMRLLANTNLDSVSSLADYQVLRLLRIRLDAITKAAEKSDYEPTNEDVAALEYAAKRIDDFLPSGKPHDVNPKAPTIPADTTAQSAADQSRPHHDDPVGWFLTMRSFDPRKPLPAERDANPFQTIVTCLKGKILWLQEKIDSPMRGNALHVSLWTWADYPLMLWMIEETALQVSGKGEMSGPNRINVLSALNQLHVNATKIIGDFAGKLGIDDATPILLSAGYCRNAFSGRYPAQLTPKGDGLHWPECLRTWKGCLSDDERRTSCLGGELISQLWAAARFKQQDDGTFAVKGIVSKPDRADGETAPTTSLKGTALAALTIIRAKKGRGLVAKEIVRALAAKGVKVTESTFYRHVVEQLQRSRLVTPAPPVQLRAAPRKRHAPGDVDRRARCRSRVVTQHEHTRSQPSGQVVPRDALAPLPYLYQTGLV